MDFPKAWFQCKYGVNESERLPCKVLKIYIWLLAIVKVGSVRAREMIDERMSGIAL